MQQFVDSIQINLNDMGMDGSQPTLVWKGQLNRWEKKKMFSYIVLQSKKKNLAICSYVCMAWIL